MNATWLHQLLILVTTIQFGTRALNQSCYSYMNIPTKLPFYTWVFYHTTSNYTLASIPLNRSLFYVQCSLQELYSRMGGDSLEVTHLYHRSPQHHSILVKPLTLISLVKIFCLWELNINNWDLQFWIKVCSNKLKEKGSPMCWLSILNSHKCKISTRIGIELVKGLHWNIL